MANREDHEHDYAETEVLPACMRPDRVEALDDAAAEAQSRYQEYVGSLDELPVLVDVVNEPPHVATKDFRLGQRRDARKAARDDAAALREQHTRDVAQRYAEYVETAQKKRAKRVERSARSKS